MPMSMKRRLERAILQGGMLVTSLHACAGNEAEEHEATSKGEAGEDGAIVGAAGAPGGQPGSVLPALSGGMGGHTGDATNLVPYPLADYPVCSGRDYPSDGGSPYSGQCCVEPHCFTPETGECPPPNETTDSMLPGLPPGSGSCGCTPQGAEAVQGPFAPRDDEDLGESGSCCYLVASIGCVGRPLLVAGRARAATGRFRSDWATRPSWV